MLSAYHRITISIIMRTTITIDDDVFEAARALAQASGIRLGQALSLLARRGLRVSLDSAKKRGLPVFKVNQDARIIPNDLACKMMAEEAT